MPGYFAVLLIAFLARPPLEAATPVADLVTSYRSKGRAIKDLAVDRAGNIHIAWTVLESKVHDPGTLFYTRLDRSGTASAESQVMKFGGADDIRIDANANNQAVILYTQMNRVCIACFDEKGVMMTELDKVLTPEEADGRFEFCRDESGNVYLFGRGSIDYFWKIDPSGKVLDERRGRWIRQPTPGFVCQLVSPTTLLIVWEDRRESAQPMRLSMAIRSIKFDLPTFSQGAVREYDLAKVSEARESGIALSAPHLTQSGRDLLYFTSVSDSASETRTYRVRFNARGDAVRRWDTKRIYHLQIEKPEDGHCVFRTGLLLSRRKGPKSLDLRGIGVDGNIYDLTGSLSALRAQ